MDGLQLQEALNELGRRIPVIIMTGNGDIQTAVRAMKAGAVDFIEKPFDDDALLLAIEAAVAVTAKIDREQASLRAVDRLADLSAREREGAGRIGSRSSEQGDRRRSWDQRSGRSRCTGRGCSSGSGPVRLADAIRLAVIASFAATPVQNPPPAETH